jgi:PAS domain S-box-containing protein
MMWRSTEGLSVITEIRACMGEGNTKDELTRSLAEARRRISALEKSIRRWKTMEKELGLAKSALEKRLAEAESGLAAAEEKLREEQSARRASEERLQLSERRFGDISEAAGEYLWETNLSGVYTFVTEKSLDVKGYRQEELIGRKPFEFIHPEDVDKARRIAREAVQKRSFFTMEHRTVAKAGKVVWEEVRGIPLLDSAGQVIGLRGTGLSVTERKLAGQTLQESEERYRTAIEHSNDGVAILVGDIHQYVNKRFVAIFGYEAPEDIVGRPLSFVVAPEDLSKVAEVNRRRQRGQSAPVRYECTGMKKSGEPLYIEVSATATTYQGKPASLVYLRDVTDRKNVEQKRIYGEKLQSALEMAATICHEMNQPMQVISGYAELMAMDVSLSGQTHKRLAKIKEQVQRMRTITEKLMTIKEYRTNDYVGISKIINIDEEAGDVQ